MIRTHYIRHDNDDRDGSRMRGNDFFIVSKPHDHVALRTQTKSQSKTKNQTHCHHSYFFHGRQDTNFSEQVSHCDGSLLPTSGIALQRALDLHRDQQAHIGQESIQASDPPKLIKTGSMMNNLRFPDTSERHINRTFPSKSSKSVTHSSSIPSSNGTSIVELREPCGSTVSE